MTSKELAEACRYLDETARSSGLDGACAAIGVPKADLRYIASQRALRALLTIQGVQPNLQKVEAYHLDPQLAQLHIVMTALALDALAIGIAATKGLAHHHHLPEELN